MAKNVMKKAPLKLPPKLSANERFVRDFTLDIDFLRDECKKYLYKLFLLKEQSYPLSGFQDDYEKYIFALFRKEKIDYRHVIAKTKEDGRGSILEMQKRLLDWVQEWAGNVDLFYKVLEEKAHNYAVMNGDAEKKDSFDAFKDNLLNPLIRILELLREYGSLIQEEADVKTWPSEFTPSDSNWKGEFFDLGLKGDDVCFWFGQSEEDIIEEVYSSINSRKFETKEKKARKIRHRVTDYQKLKKEDKSRMGYEWEKAIMEINCKIYDLTSGFVDLIYNYEEINDQKRKLLLDYLLKPEKNRLCKHYVDLTSKSNREDLLQEFYIFLSSNFCPKINTQTEKIFIRKEKSIGLMATMALRDVTNRMVKNYLKKNYWASPPESENDESEETDYGTEPSMYTKSDIEENEDEEMREFAEEEKENARLRDANLKAESSRKRMSLPDNAINKPGYIDPETEEKFFYTWQFATRIGVSEKTIRNWAKENLLPCIKKELPQKIRKLFYAPAYLIPEESLHIAQEIKKEKDNKKKHYHSEEGKIPLSSELLTRLEVCRNTLKNYMGKAYKGDKFPTGEKIDSQFYFKPDEVVQFKKLFEKHNIGHGRKADKRK